MLCLGLTAKLWQKPGYGPRCYDAGSVWVKWHVDALLELQFTNLSCKKNEPDIIPGPNCGAAVAALRRWWETVTAHSSAMGKTDLAVSDMVLPFWYTIIGGDPICILANSVSMHNAGGGEDMHISPRQSYPAAGVPRRRDYGTTPHSTWVSSQDCPYFALLVLICEKETNIVKGNDANLPSRYGFAP